MGSVKTPPLHLKRYFFCKKGYESVFSKFGLHCEVKITLIMNLTRLNWLDPLKTQHRVIRKIKEAQFCFLNAFLFVH